MKLNLKEERVVIFEQDIPNFMDRHVEIINKSLEAFQKHVKIPIEELQKDLKHIHSPQSMSIYYRDQLIISVRNGVVRNGTSFEIQYQINESLMG